MHGFRQKLRGYLDQGVRQQVTILGVVFCVVTLLVGFAAFVSANNLLFLLLAALLSTFLIAGFISKMGLAGLELHLLLPDQIAARRKVVGQLSLKNTKSWMPSFSIQVSGTPESGLGTPIYIPLIPGGSTFKEPVQVFFRRRGLYRENLFYLASRFPFGFTRRRDLLKLKQDVIVYPCIDPQAGFEEFMIDILGEIDARQRGRGSDFYRIRPYEVLESARHVDWKATAHTGDLQVREYAREQEQTVTVYLDLDVPEEAGEWFEKAVDCAAFLVWRLSRQNTALRFVTQEFDRQVPAEASSYTILKYLARVEPISGKAAPYLHEDRTIQVAITARAAQLSDSGWHPHRVLSLDDLAAACTADAGPGAATGEDLHHHRGKS